ncbi:hypothetical protein ACQKGC_08010 [Allorhizobium pseudoryzae]|uniref:hypothetical protein n=1 Tax=Allorhizobium pseudoryzae TaxID=379684 RepID=UPI003D042877
MSGIHSVVVDAVGNLHREYGFWRVARALVASALKERRRRNDLRQFSDRMLRDIGVPDNELSREYRMVKEPLVYWLGFRL